MADIRYVVAMVRREPPEKPHLKPKDVIRAEVPVEDIYKFINAALFLPSDRSFTRKEVKEAIKEAEEVARKKMYAHLLKIREGP